MRPYQLHESMTRVEKLLRPEKTNVRSITVDLPAPDFPFPFRFPIERLYAYRDYINNMRDNVDHNETDSIQSFKELSRIKLLIPGAVGEIVPKRREEDIFKIPMRLADQDKVELLAALRILEPTNAEKIKPKVDNLWPTFVLRANTMLSDLKIHPDDMHQPNYCGKIKMIYPDKHLEVPAETLAAIVYLMDEVRNGNIFNPYDTVEYFSAFADFRIMLPDNPVFKLEKDDFLFTIAQNTIDKVVEDNTDHHFLRITTAFAILTADKILNDEHGFRLVFKQPSQKNTTSSPPIAKKY